jgi:hypothetical protein
MATERQLFVLKRPLVLIFSPSPVEYSMFNNVYVLSVVIHVIVLSNVSLLHLRQLSLFPNILKRLI